MWDLNKETSDVECMGALDYESIPAQLRRSLPLLKSAVSVCRKDREAGRKIYYSRNDF